MTEDRRDPAHQFHLEEAYNKVYHLMVAVEEERDWWVRCALALGGLHLIWVAFFGYLLYTIW